MLPVMSDRTAATGLRAELFVDQPTTTVAFYERFLGFRLEREGDGYWSLRNGVVTIGIGAAENLDAAHHFRRPAATDSARGVGVELVLELPSADAVDEMHQRIRSDVATAGGRVEPISDHPWDLRDFRVIDPDGYYIRITHG